jgi:hypothetical protein
MHNCHQETCFPKLHLMFLIWFYYILFLADSKSIIQHRHVVLLWRNKQPRIHCFIIFPYFYQIFTMKMARTGDFSPFFNRSKVPPLPPWVWAARCPAAEASARWALLWERQPRCPPASDEAGAFQARLLGRGRRKNPGSFAESGVDDGWWVISHLKL